MPKDTLHVTKNSGKINEATFFKKTPGNSKYKIVQGVTKLFD